MAYLDNVKQAEALLKDDQHEQAVAMLREVVNAATQQGNKDLKKYQQKLTKAIETWAEDTNRMGDALFKRKNYREAIRYYADSLNILAEVDNPAKAKNYEQELTKAIEGLGQELNNQGDRLMKEKKFGEAIRIYAESVDTMQRAGNAKKLENFQMELHQAYAGLALQVGDQASALVKAKQWEEAIRMLDKALAFATKSQDEKVSAKIQAILNTTYASLAQEVNTEGDKRFKAKDFEKALPFYAKSVELAEKSGNKSLLANFRGELQKTYKMMAGEISGIGAKLIKENQFQEAIDVFARALEIAQQSGDSKLAETYQKELEGALIKYARYVAEQADAEMRKTEFTKAVEIWKSCWEMARRTNAPKFLKETEEGLFKASQTLVESNELKAEVLGREGKWDLAIAMHDAAVQVAEDIHNEPLIASLREKSCKFYVGYAAKLRQDADNARIMSKTQDALATLEKAISFAEKAGDEKMLKLLRTDRDKILRAMMPKTE